MLMPARLAAVAALTLGLSLPAHADTLRIAVPADPGYLDPAFWGSTSEQILIDNLYPRLGKYVTGDSWKVELDAAKSVDLSDPQNIKFELKPGLIWSGGYGELTAEDVKYSYERHLNPDLASSLVTEFRPLKSVEVTGKYTGIIHLSEPSPSFWTSTLTYATGAIISKAAAAATKGGYFEATPAATIGPYRFKSFEPGQHFVLEKNPEWKGEPAVFDEVELIPIVEDSAAMAAFNAGELDYMRQSALEFDAYQTSPPKDGDVRLMASIDPLWLGISQSASQLSNPKVRKAIQLAVDVDAIIAATTSGHGKRATGIVAPGLTGHRDANLYARDIEAARALIKEAGAEGTTIRLDYEVGSDRAAAAQIIQANLADIGLTVDLNGEDEGTFWSIDAKRAADLQLHLKSWTGNPDGLYTMQYFTTEQLGKWNWEAFQNPEYEALVAKARATPDGPERAAIYVKMQDMLEQSGDFLFITHEPYTVVTRKGITPGLLPDGRPVFAAFRKAAN